MVATSASRVALSCEPTNRSTFSSSISRIADLVDLGGRAAGVGRDELDLPAENAAGLVDLLGGKLGAGLLRRAEQRSRAAQRDEQADLEFLRRRPPGGSAPAACRMPRRPRPRREAFAARSLLANAHVNVSLVSAVTYQADHSRRSGGAGSLGNKGSIAAAMASS